MGSCPNHHPKRMNRMPLHAFLYKMDILSSSSFIHLEKKVREDWDQRFSLGNRGGLRLAAPSFKMASVPTIPQ